MKAVNNVVAITALDKFVEKWLMARAKEYENGLDGVMRDLRHGGCASGYVGCLIYSNDTHRFFNTYSTSIWELFKQEADEYGAADVFEWFNTLDRRESVSDPRNFMAWLAFEITAESIAARHGIE